MFPARRNRNNIYHQLIVMAILLPGYYYTTNSITTALVSLQSYIIDTKVNLNSSISAWQQQTRQIQQLRRALDKAQLQLKNYQNMEQEWDDIHAENRQLRESIAAAPRKKVQLFSDKPLYISHSQHSSYLYMRQNSKQPVKAKQLVIHNDHIIGQVDPAVSSTSVKVTRLNDTSTAIPARISNSSYSGVLQGNGHDELDLLYINDGAKIKIGDEVVAHKPDNNYTSQLKLGRVVNIQRSPERTFLLIKVKPLININYESWLSISR